MYQIKSIDLQVTFVTCDALFLLFHKLSFQKKPVIFKQCLVCWHDAGFVANRRKLAWNSSNRMTSKSCIKVRVYSVRGAETLTLQKPGVVSGECNVAILVNVLRVFHSGTILKVSKKCTRVAYIILSDAAFPGINMRHVCKEQNCISSQCLININTKV